MSDTFLYQAANVLYAVGYGLLFLAFGLFWLRVFFPGSLRLKDRRFWPPLTLGALAFLLTTYIQPGIQTWVNAQGSRLGWSVWVLGSLVVLVSGIVQETLKAAGLALTRVSADWSVNWQGLGAAVGLGFGVWEAWQLVAAPLGLARLWSLPAVLERWSAIGLHIGLATIIAYGFATRRPIRFAVLAVLLHAVGNFSVLLYQQWVIGYWMTEIYIFVVAFASLVLARQLWKSVRQY